MAGRKRTPAAAQAGWGTVVGPAPSRSARHWQTGLSEESTAPEEAEPAPGPAQEWVVALAGEPVGERAEKQAGEMAVVATVPVPRRVTRPKSTTVVAG